MKENGLIASYPSVRRRSISFLARLPGLVYTSALLRRNGLTPTDVHLRGVGELHDSDPEQHELLEALRRATIGEYDVYSPLGRGGMATVFLALDLSLNRPVAIKVMSPSALTHTSLVERFWLEARTAASLSHPHVIPIYAVRSVGGLNYFIMKHVDGASLDVVLKKEGPLPLPLATTILSQVSGALAYAHRRGVIHRDVKPANIMLDNEGFAIVMDFGIAKVRDIAALTTPGIMVGTPLYMSPEQISGGDIDGRSDQYSLGIVAFEMLTGTRPFVGETMPEVLRGHFMDKPPDVRSLRPDCPAVLASAISRMMCKESSDRFPTMEVFSALVASISRPNGDEVREKMSSLARSISSSFPRISQPLSPLPISSSRQPDARARRLLVTGNGKSMFSAIRKRPFLSSTVAAAVVVGVVVTVLNATQSGRSDSEQSQSETVRPLQQPLVVRDLDSPRVYVPSIAGRASSVDSGSGSVKKPTEQKRAPAVGLDINANETRQTEGQGLRAISKRKTAIASATRKSEPVRDMPETKASSFSATKSAAAGAAFVTPSAALVPPPPPPAPVPPALAVVKIGSRMQEAGLYVDGSFVSLAGSMRTISHKPGRVHLQIRAEDCLAWDTVLFVGPGDTVQVGFRNPRCAK